MARTTIVGSLGVDLIARTSKWVDGFKKAQKAQNAFASSVLSAGAKIASFVAVAVVIRKVAQAFNETRRAVDDLAKTSAKLGMTTEALSRMHYAAAHSGVGVRKLNMGLQRMARRVAEAAAGTGEAKQAILELGISAKALNKLAPDQQFIRIARAMEQVQDSGKRLRLAFKLFDSEGVDLVNMLKHGAAGLREMYQASDDLGASIRSDHAKSIERMNDKLAEANAIWNGIKATIVASAAEAMVDLIDKTKEWADASKDAEGHVTSWWAAFWGVRDKVQFTEMLAESGEAVKVQQTIQDKIKKEMEEHQEWLDSFREQNESDRLQSIEFWTSKAVKEYVREYDERLRLEDRITDEIQRAEKQRVALYVRTAQDTWKTFGSLTSALATESEKWFNINKMVAIANTTMSTLEAMTKALTLGPIAGKVAAGAIALAGAANLAAIRATTFEGGGSISAASSSPDVVAGAMERQRQSVNIVLPDNIGGVNRDFAASLINALNEAIADGYILNVSGG